MTLSMPDGHFIIELLFPDFAAIFIRNASHIALGLTRHRSFSLYVDK